MLSKVTADKCEISMMILQWILWGYQWVYPLRQSLRDRLTMMLRVSKHLIEATSLWYPCRHRIARVSRKVFILFVVLWILLVGLWFSLKCQFRCILRCLRFRSVYLHCWGLWLFAGMELTKRRDCHNESEEILRVYVVVVDALRARKKRA